MMMKPLNKLYLLLGLFATAMGFLESSVVVYLRKIYYPTGFHFPLNPIDQSIALTEFIRELATIIMMLCVAYTSGKTKNQKFGIFIFIFGVWDLFYYIFLKLILNWPENMNTWDILFLIPIPWVGPVYAPILLSSIMIIFGYLIIKNENLASKRITFKTWLLLCSGSFVSIVSFTMDYFMFHQEKLSNSVWQLPNLNDFSAYVPTNFNLTVFIFGISLISMGIINYFFTPNSLKTTL